ncbi:MAG: hypothetical protein ACW967_02000 [Candidatus Hodarchaeales archaeon]|jgi:hypothetical protein
MSVSELENNSKGEFLLCREPFIFQAGNYSRIKKLTGLKTLSDKKIQDLLEKIQEL